MADPLQQSKTQADLTLAIAEIINVGQAVPGTHHNRVSEFLKEFERFVSESSGEVVTAYLGDILKDSASQIAAELTSKIAGIAVNHFTAGILTVFLKTTDQNHKKFKKWLFVSELHAGTSTALQALRVNCTTKEDRDLRNFLVNSSIVRLNDAYAKSENDSRVLFYVRLLQGLASEATGAHDFARGYLSECLPQLQERLANANEEQAYSYREGTEKLLESIDARKQIAANPAGFIHKIPDDYNVEYPFMDREQEIRFFNGSSPIKYIENPNYTEAEGRAFLEQSEKLKKRMELFGDLIRLVDSAPPAD